MATETPVTIKTRQGSVTVLRLSKGRYLSGCRRFLIQDRDLLGGSESYEHRGRKRNVSYRRHCKGWSVHDLETALQGYDPEAREEVVRTPVSVYYEHYPESLREAVECLPDALARVEGYVQRGVSVRVSPQDVDVGGVRVERTTTLYND